MMGERMRMTEKQKEEFNKLTKQLMEFMDKEFHPHCTIVVMPTYAELLEGQMVNKNNNLRD